MTTKANKSRGMPKRSSGPPPAQSQAKNRTWFLIGAGVFALVIVAAIVAVAVAGGGGNRISEPASDAIGISGAALPALPTSGADPAVGRAIPTLSGKSLTGDPMTLGPTDGPAAIVILAHWCPHCQAEVPVLVNYLASTGMPDGVKMIGLTTSINRAQPNYPPSAWLKREGWTVPTLIDDANSSALAALGIRNFPGFVFIDADGRVVQRRTGELPAATFHDIVSRLAP